jgi:sec-independent protein translocase protein TatA
MSSGEIILILFVYLLLFGAKGVPALAQTMGKALYQFRNASREVQNEILKSTNEVRKQAELKLDQLDVDSSPKPIPTAPKNPVHDEENPTE